MKMKWLGNMKAKGGSGSVGAETLMDAIGKIDAFYVEEAELWQRKAMHGHVRYLRLAATAACLLLVMGGVFAALRGSQLKGPLSGGAGELKTGGVEDLESGGVEGPENGGVNGNEVISEAGSGDDGENAGLEGENGTAEGSASGAEGNIEKERKFEIPGEVTEVTVIHWNSETESTDTVKGLALTKLRAWADGLILGEAVPFEAAESSGENAEEVYVFRFGGQEASYYKDEVCYLVMDDVWYPVLNPADPPEA